MNNLEKLVQSLQPQRKRMVFKPEFCAYDECRKTYIPKRAWQNFCSEKCRVSNHAKLEMARIARLEERHDFYEKENDQLRQEIVALKLRIQELTK